MSTTIQLIGADVLEARLTAMEPKLARKAVRAGVSGGGEIIRKQATANAKAKFKRQTGDLFNGILKTVSVKRNPAGGSTVVARVGLRKGGKHSPFYGRILESGWTPAKGRKKNVRFLKQLVRRKGQRHVAGRPFMQPAFESRVNEALQVIQDKIREGIENLGN